MELVHSLLSFSPQCCDTGTYLDLGRNCAETGFCIHHMRPAGAIYWFSIPYRLGLPPQLVLLPMHYLLACLSIFLSAIAIKKQLGDNALFITKHFAVILLVSFLSHYVFLIPTVKTALSDPPANILALIGIWIILINPGKNNISKFNYLMIAGILFGASATIRISFLFPLLIAIFLYTFFLLLEKKRCLARIALFASLLPLLLQLHITSKYIGATALLEQDSNQGLINEHLNNKFIGYDTVLNKGGHFWVPKCHEYKNLSESITTFNFKSLGCIIFGRVNFYLGSYSPFTYSTITLDNEDKNFLPGFNHTTWSANNLYWTIHTADRSISGTKHYRQVKNASFYNKFSHIESEESGNLFTELTIPDSAKPYVLGMWLANRSANDIDSISISVTNMTDNNVVSTSSYQVNNELQRKEFIFSIPETSVYKIQLNFPARLSGESNSQHSQPDPALEIWASIDLTNPEPYIEGAVHSQIRNWSTALLLFHLILLIIVAHFIYANKRKFSITEWFAWTFIILVFAQAIVSLPEQRFAILPMICLWLVGLSLLPYAARRSIIFISTQIQAPRKVN